MTTSPTTDGGSTSGNADWYRNPSDVLESEVWKSDYPDLDVETDASGDVVSMFGCGYRRDQNDNPVVIVLSDPGDEPTQRVQDALSDAGTPAEFASVGPLPGAPELWEYVVAVGSDGDAVAIARTLNGAGVPASPDYEVFPLPGRMYFPGNLPAPAQSNYALGVTEPGKDAPVVHVIDTGLVPGLDLPGDIDGEADDRVLGTSIVVGHGTFVAGVIAQRSEARIVAWAVPENGRDRFYETDVLAAAVRLRESETGAAPTITNLSLGTVVCDHGVHDDREQPNAVPLVTLFGTASILTANDSVLVAAAGNTGGLDVATFPAAFTSRHHQAQGSEPDPAPPPIDCPDPPSHFCEMIRNRLAEVGARIVAVGASDLAGAGEQYSTEAYWVSAFRDGCQVSFFPVGSVTYEDERTPKQLPDAPLQFVDAPGNGDLEYAVADWCGTSFATAVVSAEIANAVAGGQTPADAAAAVPPF